MSTSEERSGSGAPPRPVNTSEERSGSGAPPRPVDTSEERRPTQSRRERNIGAERAALVRLVLILVAGALAAAVAGVVATVAVVLAIVAMIMLHEFGHFIVAKRSGMKVTEFFLGFGPRLWSVRRGETEYGVKAIPAGGYVKILGMSNLERDIDPADEPRTYRQKPYRNRLAVAVAGSVVHFIIAFVLLWALHAVVGVPGRPDLRIGEISGFKTGPSPAQQAGLKPGDRIVAVDGKPLRRWEDLPPYIRSHANVPMVLDIDRGGERMRVTVTPVDLNTVKVDGQPALASDEPYGFVGIGPHIPDVKANPVTAVGRAVGDLGRYSKVTLGALGQIASPSGMGSYVRQLSERGEPQLREDQPRFLSPVGFVKVASMAAENGVRAVLLLLVLINVFVGIFNMIPLPPFDGGHVAVATYERIRSRPGRPYRVDMAKLMPVAYAVVAVLVFIMVTSLYLDIFRFPDMQ